MSYLLDKKIKQKKLLYLLASFFVCLTLFYFRISIWKGLALVSHTIFSPVLVFGNYVGGKFGSVGSFFASKNSLYIENQNLQSKLLEDEARMANYNSLLAENISLKEILGRKNEKIPMVLASILSKPSQSLYDSLTIDAGLQKGLKTGEMVFALGNVPIGRIAEIYPNSAKVILFSNSGEKTQVVVGDKNVFMQIVGRGGGNFEMILPRDFKLAKGDQAVLPGINNYVVGIVETVISDPRDPFVKALLVSPVNVQELKFVEVDISAK
ncbi:MAG: rod shape-determining protein MreC [Patescibacteria group bacterium]